MNPWLTGDKTNHSGSVCTAMGAHLARMKNPAKKSSAIFLVHKNYKKWNTKPVTNIFSP